MVKFIGLKIQGIRSVGDTARCINFLAPLTIIQGPNGTGKTVKIEFIYLINFILRQSSKYWWIMLQPGRCLQGICRLLYIIIRFNSSCIRYLIENLFRLRTSQGLMHWCNLFSRISKATNASQPNEWRAWPKGLVIIYFSCFLLSRNLLSKLTTKSDEYTLKILDKHGNPMASSSKVSDFNRGWNLFNLLLISSYHFFCNF